MLRRTKRGWRGGERLFRLFSENCALIENGGLRPPWIPCQLPTGPSMIAQADDTNTPAVTKVSAAAARSRIGVRGRLFLAFSVVAGLAVALAALAILSFTEMGGVLEQITSERLPPITAALQLARTSENIV